jgi:predicted hotdog family 3-hydroxylacyl-ACP dehydratase
MLTENLPEVEDLIPHRKTMKLIDRIVAIDTEKRRLTAHTRARGNWPLADDGRIDTVICIELIAQTMGLRHGWESLGGDGPKQAGFLVGVKEAHILKPDIPVGAGLDIQVEHQYGGNDFVVYSGEVFMNGERICQAVIQVVDPGDDLLDELLVGTTGNGEG